MITVSNNDGPEIVTANYWQSEYARAGNLYISCNAGCVRVLVPPVHRGMVDECRSPPLAKGEPDSLLRAVEIKRAEEYKTLRLSPEQSRPSMNHAGPLRS